MPSLTRTCMNPVEVRRYLHSIPELGLKEFKTSQFVAGLLTDWGLEVRTGLAGTGIVASLNRGNHDKVLGLRADMDALPMEEANDFDYKSRHAGVMHACGHDGHMAMLLGAAHAMAKDPDFKGNVRFIFQPAEENVGGGRIMVKEGLFELFPCDQVFALHNMPGIARGKFHSRPGSIMASIDVARIKITGRGGHGAQPEKTVDPIVIGAQLVTALQTVVSRNIDTPGIVTVGAFHSGTASNIIPDYALLDLSMRATQKQTRTLMINRIEALAVSIAQGFGGDVEFNWDEAGYPVAVNDAQAFHLAKQTVEEAFGQDQFELAEKPSMGSEDFAFLLEKVPGAFLFIGNGDTPSVHNSAYDFNDDILPIGIAFYRNLAKKFFS